MDASRKRSRVAAVVLVAVVHGLAIYLITRLGATSVSSRQRLAAPPLHISFVVQPRLPVIQRPSRLPTKPKLARIQVVLLQPAPAFKLPVPAAPIPSAGPAARAIGSPVVHGRSGQLGAPEALVIAHYVAPVYPRAAARSGQHGRVVMALEVNAHWGVSRVKILHSSGSTLLDKAAAHAARRWTFLPETDAARGKQIWGIVQITFAPPQRLLGVPVIIMPFVAIAHEVAEQIKRNQGRRLRTPHTVASVRGMLQKLLAAFPGKTGQHHGTSAQGGGDSLEADLAALGPVRAITFLGFVDHGVARDVGGVSGTGYLFERRVAHWEAYAIKQERGSSVWLVAVSADGRIERIEVAIR